MTEPTTTFFETVVTEGAVRYCDTPRQDSRRHSTTGAAVDELTAAISVQQGETEEEATLHPNRGDEQGDCRTES